MTAHDSKQKTAQKGSKKSTKFAKVQWQPKAATPAASDSGEERKGPHGTRCHRCKKALRDVHVPAGATVLCKQCARRTVDSSDDSSASPLRPMARTAGRARQRGRARSASPTVGRGATAAEVIAAEASSEQARDDSAAAALDEAIAQAQGARSRPLVEAVDDEDTPWCREMLATGECGLGRRCEYRHPDVGSGPTAIMAPAGPGPGEPENAFYRRVTDPYLENLDNPHLRTLEPTAQAYATYLIPRLRTMGLELMSNTPTSAANKYLSGPIGMYIDTGHTVRVRLLRDVVDTMRLHFRYSARSATCAEFLIGTHRAVRACSELRIPQSEVDVHKHYASLVGWYDREHDRDVARVFGAHGGDPYTAAAIRAAIRAVASPAGAAVTLSAGVAAAAVVRQHRVVRQLRRQIARQARVVHPRAVGAADLAGAVVGADPVGAAAAGAATAAEALLQELPTAAQLGRQAGAAVAAGGSWATDAWARARAAASRVAGRVRARAGAAVDSTAVSTPSDVRESDLSVGIWTGWFMPTSEEAMKHANSAGKFQAMSPVGLRLTTFITAFETLRTIASLPTLPASVAGPLLMARLLTCIMHYAAWALPLSWAVVLHVAWNNLACSRLAAWCNSHAPQSNLGPGAAAGALPTGVAALLGALVVGAAWRVAGSKDSLAAFLERRERAADLRRQLNAVGAQGAAVVSDAFLHKKKAKRVPRPVAVYPGERMVPPKVVKHDHTVRVVKIGDTGPEDEMVDFAQLWGAWTNAGSTAEDGPLLLQGGVPGKEPGHHRVAQVGYGFGSGPYRPMVPSRSNENDRSVVDHRIAVAVPDGDFATCADFIGWCIANEDEIFRWPSGAKMRVRPVSREYFLSHVGSSPTKLRELRDAFAYLDANGIHDGSSLSPRFARYAGGGVHKVFTKREGLSKKSLLGPVGAAPRPICPSKALMAAIVGPWLMAYGATLRKIFSVDNFATFVSAEANARALGAAIGDAFERGFWTLSNDFSRWDMTMNSKVAPLNEYDVAHYRRIGCPRAACTVLMADCSVTIITQVWKIVKKAGQMSSGRDDTNSGDGRRNVQVHLYTYCRHYRLEVREARKEIKMLGNGDDQATAHRDRPGPKPDWQKNLGALGHEANPFYTNAVEDVSFCSANPYHTSDGWKYTPMFGRGVSRCGYFVDPPRDVEGAALVRGAALSMVEMVNHIPPWRALVARLLELTAGHRPVYPPKHQHMMVSGGMSWDTPRTWEQLHRRYGWTPAAQAEWEEELSRLQLGDEITGAWPRACMERDTDGFKDGPAYIGDQPFPVEIGEWGPPLCPAYAGLEPGDLPVPDRYGWVRDLTRDGIEPNPGPSAVEKAVLAVAAGGAAALLLAWRNSHALTDEPQPVHILLEIDGRTIPYDAPCPDGVVDIELAREHLREVVGPRADTVYFMANGKEIIHPIQLFEGQVVRCGTRGGLRGGGTGKKKKVVLVASTKKKKALKVAKGGHIRGKGDYKVTIGGQPAGKALGGAVGSLWGSTGRTVGEVLGGGLHRAFKWFTGFGDYKQHMANINGSMSRQDKMGSMLGGKIPSFSKYPQGVVIEFEEMIGPVTGSVNFASTKYFVNPGMSSTFPWLSNVAVCFQQYHLLGAVFQYRPLMAESSAASAMMGEVGLTSDYNANDAAATNMQVALNADYSNSGRGCDPFLHAIECDETSTSAPVKYVRQSGVTQSDLRWNDQCITQVVTQGFPAAAAGLQVGELWVSYKVALMKPSMNVMGNGRSCHIRSTAAGNGGVGFVPSVSPMPGSTISLRAVDSTALNMPKIAGSYLLHLVATMTDSSGAFSGGWSLKTISSDIAPFSGMGRGSTGTDSFGQLTPLMYSMTGTTAVMTYMFQYSASITDIASRDIVIDGPTFTGVKTCNIDIFLFSREPGLAVACGPTREEEIRLAVARALGPSSIPAPVGGMVGSWVVEETTTESGAMRLQQWPYNGPLPPDGPAPEELDDEEIRHRAREQWDLVCARMSAEERPEASPPARRAASSKK